MTLDCATHKFEVPARAVLSPGDITKWETSEAYQDIMGFLTSMNNAVRGKKLSAPCDVTPVIKNLLEMLDTLSQWIDEIPPIDQPQRFGNKAFRDFYAKLKENGEELVKKMLPEKYHSAVPEVAVYLVESVGNSTRIDYGTGHELAFVMFLTCIFKIGALVQSDSIATVNKVFNRYLELARKLQITYKMEPAGSQGVWSLDDYQFIPFIWGSSQLHMHPKIAPELFSNEKVVEENADEYMFLGCIKFILSVKTGPFAEHSNQLWNISGVQSWGKINQGLFKMYKAEILAKFPVIQHVLFGTILSITPASEIKYQASGSELPGMRRPMGSFPPPGSAPMGDTRFPAPGSAPMGDTRFPAPGAMPMAGGRFPAPGSMPLAEGRFPAPVIQGKFPNKSDIPADIPSLSSKAASEINVNSSGSCNEKLGPNGSSESVPSPMSPTELTNKT
ncbi:serine/threonine-protein phosphatase 2A activator-like [Macrobrachium nipponense]|uniref:serine/threonine-protein phosphatase 2A activator-like n=1 Tax=Macrobrachium nipponense TaxID=159736 RepID=UPI0030C89049